MWATARCAPLTHAGIRRTASRKPKEEDRQTDGGAASESFLGYHPDCHKDRGRQSDTPSDTSFRSAEGNPEESGTEAISL